MTTTSKMYITLFHKLTLVKIFLVALFSKRIFLVKLFMNMCFRKQMSIIFFAVSLCLLFVTILFLFPYLLFQNESEGIFKKDDSNKFVS